MLAASVPPSVSNTVRSSITGHLLDVGIRTLQANRTPRRLSTTEPRLHCSFNVFADPSRVFGAGISPADAHLLLAGVRATSPPGRRAGLPLYPPAAGIRLPTPVP